jgi:hypothetical protein
MEYIGTRQVDSSLRISQLITVSNCTDAVGVIDTHDVTTQVLRTHCFFSNAGLTDNNFSFILSSQQSVPPTEKFCNFYIYRVN